MHYTMLVYLDDAHFHSLPPEEQNRIHRECGAWHDELVQSGHSCAATGLQRIATATPSANATAGS